MSKFYKNSKKITDKLVNKTLGKFNNARLDLMKTDELNVPQVTERIDKLYDNLLDETKKGLQEIKDNVEEQEKKPSTYSVEEYLEDYNPLLTYVPLNEAVRKRERYIENILALTLAIGKVGSSEGLNTADMLSTQKKAVRLWNTQMSEAFADFERETHKSCWENDGVEYVRWIAQDGACGYCDELNGQVFVLGDEPPLQHINCRCELEPVEKNEDFDFDIKNFEDGYLPLSTRASGQVGDTYNGTVIDSSYDIDYNDIEKEKQSILDFLEKHKNSDVEHAIVITPNGIVFELTGNSGMVNPIVIGEDLLKGSIGGHTHPILFDGKADAHSKRDVLFTLEHSTGGEFVKAGSSTYYFEYNGNLSVKEMSEAYRKAYDKANEIAYERNAILDFPQLETMKILSETIEGFEFYEL